MGGRGSGGGRSGGGGGASASPQLGSMNEYIKNKYSEMTDLELNRAYVNAQKLMKNEQVKVEFEQRKLSKMVDEFKGMKDDDPNLDKKWDAIEKQTSILDSARARADIRSQAYLLAVNEKYNIRGKYDKNDVKKMTNGQLNSFYNTSYKESNKARNKAENTKNAKTREKYQKIYDAYNKNFLVADKERNIRGLDGKGW